MKVVCHVPNCLTFIFFLTKSAALISRVFAGIFAKKFSLNLQIATWISQLGNAVYSILKVIAILSATFQEVAQCRKVTFGE